MNTMEHKTLVYGEIQERQKRINKEIHDIKMRIKLTYPYTGTCNIIARTLSEPTKENIGSLNKRFDEYSDKPFLVATFKIFFSIYSKGITPDLFNRVLLEEQKVSLNVVRKQQIFDKNDREVVLVIKKCIREHIDIENMNTMMLDKLMGIIVQHHICIYDKLKKRNKEKECCFAIDQIMYLQELK